MIRVEFIEGVPKSNFLLAEFARKAVSKFRARRDGNLASSDYARDREVCVRETPKIEVERRMRRVRENANFQRT